MNFEEGLKIIIDSLSDVGVNVAHNYDGLIVKELVLSNTLDSSRSGSKQTHIAITGPQMDIFPYVRADGYLNVDYSLQDNDLKKYYVAQIPVYLHNDNLKYLDKENDYESEKVYVSVVRSKRENQPEQIQFSLPSLDSPSFVEFRKLLRTGDTIVLLKRENSFLYDIYGLRAENSESLKQLNNVFLKKPTNTKVPVDMLLAPQERESFTIEELASILSNMYNTGESKITALHMFGLLYKNAIKDAKYKYKNIFDLAGIVASDSNTTELTKGVGLNTSISNNDFNVVFADKYNIDIIDKDKLKESSVEDLGIKLKEMYDADGKNKNSAILTFGIKYGNIIRKNEIKSPDIVKASGISEKYSTEVDKALRIYDSLFKREYKIGFKHLQTIGYNKIYYGIPGCGKSHHIQYNVLKNVDKNKCVVRTTFYPDYTNSDFIGQIRPVVKQDKSVEYDPVPGPFTKILEKAYQDPYETYYLVIEELNRGNAAAIFGDTFQLLDRLERPNDGRFPGDSEYPISNEFIEDYFTKHNVTFIPGKIFIPHNLIILATMNTSDQNVFTLDTAFKRRWDRERVISDWDDVNNDIKDLLVPGTNITWKNFAEKVNYRITTYDKEGGVSFEDKQLGAYFATKDMLVCPGDDDNTKKRKKEKFMNNVIDYLFNDVVTFNPEKLFGNNTSYDALYRDVVLGEGRIKNYGLDIIFEKPIYDGVETSTTDDEETADY